MTINYPNGSKINQYTNPKTKKETPAKRKAETTQFDNRGMNFEEDINQSNLYYLNHDLAVICKKPTPIQIVKVDYPRRSAAVIREAYFRQASTTDYNGVYDGYYLDFEAKETKNKTSFPLKNFHPHQIQHMEKCARQNGICFVLLWFSTIQRCFLLEFSILNQYWRAQSSSGKKSIPLKSIEEKAYEVELGVAPRVPYIDYVKKIIKNRKEKTS